MPLTFCTAEKDAREKLCPMSFAVPEQRAPDGCGIREGGPWPCFGSRCMAWRWVITNISDGEGGLMPSSDTHGYCGMAGPTICD